MRRENLGADTPSDPDRLEEIYERARAMDPAGRAEYLASACAGDPRMERQLRSLLEHSQPAESFFAVLAESVTSPAVGHEVGHYRLIGVLGSGGMGTVYRAHDTRLDRTVALKFLPSYLSHQPEARERFVVEARSAAGLDHPNVCRIHEIGETADGRPFIAMTCYEGETLRERLVRGPVPPVEAVRIAAQVATGLGAAHARGIVHRDVKPGNIMLCSDGSVRLLDFGLAKLGDLGLTAPGVTPGTVAYMSPEQVSGDSVDCRSDLWSLGVVFYEMVSGVRPFRGGNDRAIIQAILHEQPDPLGKLSGVSQNSLALVVERLLRKLPQDRYRDVEQLLHELRPGNQGVGHVPGHASWMKIHRRVVMTVGAGLIAVLALLLVFQSASRRGVPTAADGQAPRYPTIAVLPFTVRGNDLDIWREGMVDLLSLGLEGAGGIRVVDSRTLLARWHQEVGENTLPDLALALSVAQRAGAQYALVGSAVQTGERIRLGATVYDVDSRREVGPVQVDGPSDSVLSLIDRLGLQTLTLMIEDASSELPTLDLAAVTTTSLVALKAYLDGEERYRRSEIREAADAWERAVRTDSLFALAYVRLTEAYAWYDAESYRENLERAKRMAERLPARERMLALARWAGYTGAPRAVAITREVIRKYPDAAEAWFTLGEVAYHQASAMETAEESEAAFRMAAQLQPTIAPYRAHLVDLAFLRRPDSARIARELDAYTRLAPDDTKSRAGRIALALAYGNRDTRARALAELRTLNSESAAQVYLLLVDPAFARVREEVFQAIDPHLKPRDRPYVRDFRFRTLALMDGRVREALAMLNDSTNPSYLRYGGALYLADRGLPVPAEVIAQSLAAGLADKSLLSSRKAAISVAGAAARLGQWGAYDTVLHRIRELASREATPKDSVIVPYWTWAVRVAEAEGLSRRGRNQEALRAFERTLPGDGGWFTLWHVGRLSLTLGRVEQAENAFRSLWYQDLTPAYLERARILERTGHVAEAREAYRFVINAWRHADPELQPQVEMARQAVARLSPTVRAY